MNNTTESITVTMTESGDTTQATVLNKRADRIQVVLGEGVHSVRCELKPTRNELAYSGRVMGREIVYERSVAEVKTELERADPRRRQSRPVRR